MAIPPGHDEIQRQELSRLFGQMVRVRLVAVVPGVAAVLWLALVEPAPWRRAVLLAAAVGVPAFFIVEWLRYQRHGVTPRSVPLNLGIAAAMQLVITLATGGLASPFVYVIVLFGILCGVFVPRPAQHGIVALQVAAVWVFAAIGATAAIPDLNLAAFGGGSRVGAPPAYLYAHAALITLVVLAAGGIGRAIRRVFESTIRRALAARQESLDAHAERAEELTALSAEIAHELKNPLASVKGLAGLLEQNVAGAKGTERLAVLRREVDRMQAILDEFLNFSRPLVPLALGDADVGALCREVEALHEGVARERGVALEVDAGEVRARCDPRKVKQIVINLVQNALDASPPGAAVAIGVLPVAGGGARVRVLDRGGGLEPGVAGAVFSPGVTTKPTGSGLGLTIARALARQHGGELTLSARPGGGVAAELVLPPPAGAAASASPRAEGVRP